MTKYILSLFLTLTCALQLKAQDKIVTQPQDVVVCESFWNGWFVEAGLDMTLHNPYGHDFSEVIPKGTSFGLNAGIGKWFSPDIGLRGRVNWENGFPLFENRKLEWIAPAGAGGVNMDEGGCLLVYLDVLLDMKNLINGYDADRKWTLLVMPRMGIASNFAINSGSPFVGAGVGLTRTVTKKLSLYGDFAVHIITSEYYGDVGPTGMSVQSGSNSFFILNVGVRWKLGK